ncbi:hypothetical protein KAR91_47030 [Candidatus Pacearchaeota archaeon]|nr:hypothetical protein [Candidatus Pacearchaeota archaeon]
MMKIKTIGLKDNRDELPHGYIDGLMFRRSDLKYQISDSIQNINYILSLVNAWIQQGLKQSH